MTYTPLTLFCLVDNEVTAQAFSVEIDRTKTVDHLRDLIKAKQSPDFDDIVAKSLTLWCVSIPITEDDEIPKLLSNVIGKEKKKLGPATLLSKVFPEELPEETVHVIVQRPALGTALRPSMMSMSRTPTAITEWADFPTQAAALNHPTNRTLSSADYQFSTDLFASNEGLQTTTRIGTYSDIARVLGKPDRICYNRTSQELRILIEIKTTQALSCNNLVTKYTEDMDLIANDRAPTNPTWRQVHQIFGYLCNNSLRYGILTTYDDTWFMRRDVGKLWISPSIRHDNFGPTLLQCYKYFMELPDQDYTSPPPPPSPSQSPPPESPPGDGSNDGSYHERKKSSRKRDQQHPGIVTRSRNKIQQIFRQLPSGFTVSVGELNLREFEIQELLGQGRTGRVFQAKWQGDPVALKVCDLYKNPEFEDEILSELATYRALMILQGVYIPRLKAAGYDGGLFSLAMDIAGTPVEVDKLSYQERLTITKGLFLIHQHGIIHNDLRLENILVCYNNGFQVRFIDFARSRRTCDGLELRNEMVKLESLLRPDQHAIVQA
ncbi:hypothetical protein BGZ95_006653 [Linnemannia exigua]|uniref:Protein kinase domain-containing protein n=1 Tax=Linnemannia exigua TaxID=604196 RepID=A0AAD4DG92_9FUNG|nr:hypothetical protein BGZ95_006653 [Linnemannia exigua]